MMAKRMATGRHRKRGSCHPFFTVTVQIIYKACQLSFINGTVDLNVAEVVNSAEDDLEHGSTLLPASSPTIIE